MIVTGDHHFGLRPNKPVGSEHWKDETGRAAIRRGIRLQPIAPGVPVLAPRVNHGAWIVDCPDPACRGAEYCWEDGMFMCWSCFNASSEHCYLPTAFPPQRRAIEAVLDLRPEPNRNWDHHESVADLQIENIEHDVPVPTEVN